MKSSRWLLPASLLIVACSKPPATPMDRGKATFARMCSGCHGMGGTGGGMPTLNQAPPRDLTDAAFQASKTDDELLFSVRNGKGNMPAFGVTLTDEQLRDVLLYVRSLAKP